MVEPSPTSDTDVLTTIIRKEMRGVHSKVELQVLEWFKEHQARVDAQNQAIIRLTQANEYLTEVISSKDRELDRLRAGVDE